MASTKGTCRNRVHRYRGVDRKEDVFAILHASSPDDCSNRIPRPWAGSAWLRLSFSAILPVAVFFCSELKAERSLCQLFGVNQKRITHLRFSWVSLHLCRFLPRTYVHSHLQAGACCSFKRSEVCERRAAVFSIHVALSGRGRFRRSRSATTGRGTVAARLRPSTRL